MWVTVTMMTLPARVRIYRVRNATECELMFLEVGETLETNSLTSVWLAVLVEDRSLRTFLESTPKK